MITGVSVEDRDELIFKSRFKRLFLCSKSIVMRFLVGGIFFVFFVLNSFSQESIKFALLKQELGDLREGEVKQVVFVYQNISNDSVKVADVVPQCGCTVAHFEDKMLLPEERSEVVLLFDTKDKLGLQRKTISLVLENDERYVLVIAANVLPSLN